MKIKYFFKDKVIVKVAGGLGNQLFQYATGRALSINKKVPLWLDISFFNKDELYNRGYLLDKLNIHPDRVFIEDYSKKRHQRKLVRYYKKIEKYLKIKHKIFIDEPYFLNTEKKSLENYFSGEPYNKFHKELLENTSKNIFLTGYWQSDKYFRPYKEIISQDLKPKNNIPDSVNTIANEIDNINSVCIGVRQYADSHASLNHFKLTEDYYKKAIQKISEQVENPHFYIFTLETKWAEENIKSEHPITIVDPHSGNNEAHIDLYLMTKCKHFIIANSTYHWWGAYLSDHKDKIVIAPEKGWGNEYPTPNEWIKI